MTRFIQNPRAKWRIYKLTRPIHWGGWFPVFSNMGVIGASFKLSSYYPQANPSQPSATPASPP
jgi:hypothetical protein